jgi:peptidoglycan/LPS O-acetylase OafA/YrhL
MSEPGPVPATYEAYQARKYLPELDGLRAISVLLVVSAHLHDKVWGWLGGWLGVSVFFMLSGYLIMTLSLREERQRGSLSFGGFYIRRCFRIFPLYYVLLLVYVLLILGSNRFPEKKPMLEGALPWYLTYMQEVPYSFGIEVMKDGQLVAEHKDIPFYQTWSLGIEEKFYLVWPLLIFALWRGRPALRKLGTVVLIGVFVASPYMVPKGGLDNCLFWYYQILVGCLLALLMEDVRWFERMRFLAGGVWPWLTFALVLGLHCAFAVVPEKTLASYALLFGYTVALGPFLVSLLLGAGPIQSALRWGPLVFVGKLSYGIYLVHILCLNVAQKVFPPNTGNFAVSAGAYALACAISIGVAWVLALVVEKPLIEIGRRWSKRVMSKDGELAAAGKGV